MYPLFPKISQIIYKVDLESLYYAGRKKQNCRMFLRTLKKNNKALALGEIDFCSVYTVNFAKKEST